MNFFKSTFQSRLLGAALLAVPAIAGLSSCDAFNEDLDPCLHGVELHFRYDYNLEFANAFPAQVDCLTLFIYDANGNYLGKRSEQGAPLTNEHYAMTVDLPAGDYHFVAYGGMECEKSSFHFVETPAAGSRLSDLEVEIDAESIGKNLHPLFFGDLDVTVRQSDLTYVCDTVPMIKDTNNLRVVLWQLNNEPVLSDDFDFKVVDDNTLMGWDNNVIPTSPTSFTPWAQGQVSSGLASRSGESALADNDENTDKEVIMAYAEMSFPRLVTTNSPRLVITRRNDNHTVVDIPLLNYLLALKSEVYHYMPAQEFLDRENMWSMIFILDSQFKWVAVDIKVRDWTVRINDVNL